MKSGLPENIRTDRIQVSDYSDLDIDLSIARFDLIDPIVSGNKIFKLHDFIQNASAQKKKIIVTKGGPYSNHLVATAQFCFYNNLSCIGIVRGEKPPALSHSLEFCISKGMQLIFSSREEFNAPYDHFKNKWPKNISFSECYFIPEGGFDPMGARGASLMHSYLEPWQPTHICVAVGTATTLAGLVLMNKKKYNILGIPVLKGLTDIEKRLSQLLPADHNENPIIIPNYHFEGYAKKNDTLIEFMNTFYQRHQIPTDFVYTGKLMFGAMDLIKKGYFPSGSNIIVIHSGGLQGNLSLPKGTLIF